MPRSSPASVAAAAAVGCLGLPSSAAAHAFGVRYDLPLPLDYYLAGAGAVVLLSFVILALTLRSGAVAASWQLRLPPLPAGASRILGGGARLLGVLCFLLVLAAGLFGVQWPTQNIAPLIVWVLWWVGFLFLTAFVGNAWPLLNPWSALYRLVERPPPDGGGGAAPGPLGGWLATLLFFIFAWLELVSTLGESPRGLALAILLFSLGTWAGMATCGRDAWLTGADPFHRVFGLFGRFAPLGRGADGALVLRPPGAGLLGRHPAGLGQVAFVILVLATVTFDGLSETPLWAAVLEWLASSTSLRPLLLWLADSGLDLLAAAKTAGLLATALLFFAAFGLVCWMSARAGGGVATRQAMQAFALSFLPIAIAYHLAHYLSYLLLAGQLAVPLASDPLGFGWDLFGTRGEAIDIGVIGARTVWYVAVVAIVTGHVISVTLAHLEALRLFATPRRALFSQLPMLALMIAFTVCSLWILSQPIVQDAR